MRASWRNKGTQLLVVLALLLAGVACTQKQADPHEGHTTGTQVAADAYTCPMHPEVISDKPGKCPICKMNLEPKDKVLEQLTADPNGVVVSSQATVKASYHTQDQPIQVQGTIAFDERRNKVVSAYFAGRIEELFVKYNYTLVKKGQPILTLYSPDLLTAQEEFLFVLNAGDRVLAEQARKRLRLLGLTAAQLNTLERTRKPQPKITVFSPFEGYLQFAGSSASAETPAVGSAPAPEAGGMGGMDGGAVPEATAPTTAGAAENALREGQYLSKGQALFTVNDLKTVWAILTIPASATAGIKVGNVVSLTSPLLPGQALSGKVDFLEPVVREGQSQVTVRVYLNNPAQKLKPNALVQATVMPGKGNDQLVVPASAVWSLGRRHIVWVRKDPVGAHSFTFQAREVQVGQESGGFVQILSGLPENARIAKEAGYMTDSESFINPQ
ncbi:efflux RND transporter periplasmic adaptor subunit [Rufibacter soli]|jgi:membrane fusion protein, copper/silver efflux system